MSQLPVQLPVYTESLIDVTDRFQRCHTSEGKAAVGWSAFRRSLVQIPAVRPAILIIFLKNFGIVIESRPRPFPWISSLFGHSLIILSFDKRSYWSRRNVWLIYERLTRDKHVNILWSHCRSLRWLPQLGESLMPVFVLCLTRSSAVPQRSVNRSMKASLRITFPEVHAATERYKERRDGERIRRKKHTRRKTRRKK